MPQKKKWKQYRDNPNTAQYIFNAFWNQIGFEQGTNRAILHDGTMQNARYLNGLFFYQQDNERYLFDSINNLLLDTSLNFYDGQGYYDNDFNFIEDIYEDTPILTLKEKFKNKDKLFQSLVNQDPIYGNGKAKDPIINDYQDYFTDFTESSAHTTYTNKSKTVYRNFQNTGTYTVNSDEKFKQKFQNKTQARTQKTSKQPQQKVKTSNITKEQIQQTVEKDPIFSSFIKNENRQQEAVDKIIAEQQSKNKNIEKTKIQTSKPKNKMVTKQLTGPTIQEKTFSGTRLDTRGHSMTQAVHEYNNRLKASTSSAMNATKSTATNSNIYKPIRNGVDAATVGKIITGVADSNVDNFAAKIAADFSTFRYGKQIAKLF